MKPLIILNENEPKAHIDVYDALDSLVEDNDITGYRVIPFLFQLNQGIAPKKIINNILDECRDYLPDVILWMHTDNFAVSSETIQTLRQLNSKPAIGYWDGDLYQSPYRPVPK